MCMNVQFRKILITKNYFRQTYVHSEEHFFKLNIIKMFSVKNWRKSTDTYVYLFKNWKFDYYIFNK